MNYKIVILDEAKIDFRESLFWYKNVDSKLAQRFLLSFKESLILIQNNPFNFQIRYDDVRIFLLTSFPYLIHYTIYKNKIVIKAIYHSSRDSKLNIYK
jgi:hypothetical protein